MIKPAFFIVAAGLLAACATGASTWSQASWLSQQAQEVNSGPYRLSASPLGGDGFKLKLSVSTDSFFRVARSPDMPPPDEATLIEAAKAAAPEGCEFVSLELTEDGGAVADYDCG